MIPWWALVLCVGLVVAAIAEILAKASAQAGELEEQTKRNMEGKCQQ